MIRWELCRSFSVNKAGGTPECGETEITSKTMVANRRLREFEMANRQSAWVFIWWFAIIV
jgi:hypothetical protein